MPSDWERVDADPVLLAALRRHYAGSGDPLDRLWWAEHPGVPTPSGRPDPGTDLETARRALFRRDGDADPASVERAAAAEAADRAAARLALAAADAERRTAGADRPGPRHRPARLALVGAVVAALVVGGGIGFASGRFTRVPAAPALAVLDRPQRTDDRPPSVADLPGAVPRSATRYLGSSSTTGVVVYGARAADGRICLIATVLAARFAATCASPETFAGSGLSLALQATADPQDDSGVGTVQEVDPHWTPDGRLTF